MAGKDMIVMSQQELKRVHVIQNTLEKQLTQKQAAQVLGISDRQVRRIKSRILEEGEGGIIHRSRGKPAHNRIEEKIKSRIIRLSEKVYDGFGPTLVCEKLLERDAIRISRETIRKWFQSGGIGYRGRKKRPHRQWRERRKRYGQMIQIDGSEHDWFEGRGPKCVLIGYIDDATNEVYGRFYGYEGTIPAMDSFKRYSKKYGIPMSVYLDRHTTYKSTKNPTIEDDLANRQPLSQFERALAELTVDVIHAYSAPAKGRIERLFKTFQDRVVKEMRLRNICTIEQANVFLEEYLPEYNKRFRVAAAEAKNMHRAIPAGLDLERILCIKTMRALRKDRTVAHNKKWYQVKDALRSRSVMVEDRTDGSVVMWDKEQKLRVSEIFKRPETNKQQVQRTILRGRTRSGKQVIPGEEHVWRHFKLRGSRPSKMPCGYCRSGDKVVDNQKQVLHNLPPSLG